MPTTTLSPTAYRIRKLTGGGLTEETSLPMECGQDFYGERRSIFKFAAPSDLLGATIHTATLNLTVAYYSGFGETSRTVIGIIDNGLAFSSQSTTTDPPLGTLQAIIEDENWPGAFHGVITTTGTAVASNVKAMIEQAIAAGRLDGGDIQFAWITPEATSDYYQYTTATPSLYIDYTPAPLLLTTTATSVRVGSTITGTLIRSGSTSSGLTVTLSQWPSGRLTIPSTETILAGSSSKTFNITGIAAGAVTLTATAGSDTSNRSLRVLADGLGDEEGWWCPSLDTAGNGTSTVFDLSATGVDGTLTDMEPSSDWPTDTANGGIRALDFDGIDDFISFGDSILPANSSSVSLAYWMRRPLTSSRGPFFGLGNGTTTNRIEIQPWNDNLLYVTFTSSIYGSIPLDTDWHHYVVAYDGAASGNANRLKIYKDGVAQTVSFAGTIPSTVGADPLTPRIGKAHSDNFGAGRADDMRVFSRSLTQAEVLHLYSLRGVLGGPTVAGIGNEVAWYCPSLDRDGAGTSTANDLSANSNDATLIAMDPATDWPPDAGNGGVRALDFDGTNDFLSIADASAHKPSSITVSGWFRLLSTDSFFRTIICKPFRTAPWSTPFVSYMIRANSNTEMEFDVGNGTAYSAATVTVGELGTSWHHALMTYNGTTMRGYLDGVLVLTRTNVSGAIGYTAGLPLLIGADHGNSPQAGHFPGRLDDVRIFDREVTANEIAHLASFRGVLGPAPPPAGMLLSRIDRGLINRSRINLGLIR